MIGRIILALMAFALVVAVFKMVLLAIILAGLIFRTKATLGLLAFGALVTLIGNHPAIGLTLLGIIIVAAIVGAVKKQGEGAATESD